MVDVGIEQSTSFAKNSDNRRKNRYRNIVPYDDRCLMLDEVDGMDILETEYINATYIDGFSRNKEYIVAQGPMSNTCADFWRMVWLERVETIVMLTRIVENEKQKCFKYWSDDDAMKYEGLTVEVELQNEMMDYTVRKIKLQLMDEVRHVVHYYFRSWPDHGVPTHASDLLGLIYRVRRDTSTSNAPLVVHCSAGVGRSGTYVTIDTLLNTIEANQCIDVNGTVRKLRLQRMLMVQSVMQYILIHNAVLEAYFTRKTEIPIDNFTREFAKLQVTGSGFKKEFDVLLQLSRPLDKSESKAGLLPAVLKRKNRISAFIPPDTVRVVLHSDNDDDYYEGAEGGDYINASYVNGYYKPDVFIVTQAPLPATTVDMWRMVFEQNATAIVNLAQPNEHKQYWPSSESESYGNFNVKWMSSDHRRTFSLHKIQLTKFDEPAHDIALFHYQAWPDDATPSDIASLLEMMAHLEQWQKRNEEKHLIVHCCTGMGRTGVFCAVYNLLDQIKNERVANVMHVTKVLLNQRQGIIQTPGQYESIYGIINHYLKDVRTYANTL
jgi:protein tyrosine phosphatase